ncbi:zinc-dependent peptidase [Acidihalobacter ferrooxydans]|nr:zinc-dependent peptidase [Acidihalobacter ferrooxydans]
MTLLSTLSAKLHHRPPPFDAEIWRRASADQAVLTTLPDAGREKLWALAHDFLRTRAINPVGGLALENDARLRLALLAALPVLELGLNWYHGLHEVVVYPAGFAPQHNWTDECGIVHTERRALSGEAWNEGLLIVSWADVQAAAPLDGHHVVLHECAHWLDMQAGAANGRPPLHPGMSAAEWTRVFTQAYAAFRHTPRHYPSLDPYAAEAPAEFFAVACEAFFEIPHALTRDFPAVYALLAALLRQDPRQRIAPLENTP